MRPLEYSEDLVMDLCRVTGMTPAEIEESLASAHAAVAGCMAALLQAYRMTKELSTIADLMAYCKHERAANGGIGKPNADFYNMTSRDGRRLREEYLKLQTAWRMTAKEIRHAYNQATWFAANADEVDLDFAKPAGADDPDVDDEEEVNEARQLLAKFKKVIAVPDEDKKRERRTVKRTRKAVEAEYVVHEARKDEVESA